MANYIASDNIFVYPSARRGISKPEARLVSESALVRIVNKLIDKQGFVVTETFSNYGTFEFNIYGYYFKINEGHNITDMFTIVSPNTTIYGKINLTEMSDNFVELAGQDDLVDSTYYFKGIEFTTTEPTESATVKYLALLTNADGSWGIVPDSRFKFDDHSFQSLSVDGGII